jgi:phage gpG-like protein
MIEFDGFEDFIAHLRKLPPKILEAQAHGLKKAAEIVQHEAQEIIGETDVGALGPFAAWAPLSSATMEGFIHPLAGYIPGKIELGYTGQKSEQDALLRTGALRDSINFISDAHEAIVGSPMPEALWQEMGTPNARYPIPPRSFLGRSAFNNRDKIVHAVMFPICEALAGRTFD